MGCSNEDGRFCLSRYEPRKGVDRQVGLDGFLDHDVGNGYPVGLVSSEYHFFDPLIVIQRTNCFFFIFPNVEGIMTFLSLVLCLS